MTQASDSDEALITAAKRVRGSAYAPYSGFRVGAAVLDSEGRVHVGCNVENAAYPLGACAESNAIGAMVAQGGTRIRSIAVVGGSDGLSSCTPCGGCRQRIAEFSDPETVVILTGSSGSVQRRTIESLLPEAFSLRV